ncbi:hypothetical protein [Bacillus thermotolerans]|uniref:Uncharacterized protein n=1 Tax=Bacillus thermotolerans TaxID=1221996 RepID=A0A0F5I8Z4_BACTR|nr:hypothetical protein [Bacillus thermotolerans]KKB41770.1 hypothetical protein QY95_00577 [Bacillus thermotolerans]KKB44338.1 hypothetical protein QY96_02938 [Bacillus thermotolerans]
MIDAALMANVVSTNYTEEQRKALVVGFCPECLPTLTDYRILETFYSDAHQMDVIRVKCSNISECEWEEVLPARRSDNGLENFFES